MSIEHILGELLKLRALRYLIAMAEEGDVSNAVASLHIAQPTLSRQLSALENEISSHSLGRSGNQANNGTRKIDNYFC